MSLKIKREDFSFDAQSFCKTQLQETFEKYGVVILSNAFKLETVEDVIDKVQSFLEKPSVAGTYGYFKKDYTKRFLDPFMIAGDIVDFCVHELSIDIIEEYMGAECVLSEASIKQDRPTPYVYFPIHSDYGEGYERAPQAPKVTREMLQEKLAVGGIVYLQDVPEYGFYYSVGSHQLCSAYGGKIDGYPAELKDQILNDKVVCTGEKGDIILFDDRGFHGPSQPASSNRTVLILDWLNSAVWGVATQIAPFYISTADIGRLSDKQLRVLGVGAKSFIHRADYHVNRYYKKYPKRYKMIKALIESTGVYTHTKLAARALITAAKEKVLQREA